jgi:ABC-2 type transport system permease protein
VSTFLSLFKKEVACCFLSPIAYVVMFFFWVLTGGNFMWLLRQLANGESLTIASQLMFSGPLLTFTLPAIIPLITMRLLAEERKLGTLEALLTTSAKVPELVLAKFAGALFFYMVLWLPIIAYIVIQSALSPMDGIAFPDMGGLRAGAFGVVLVGSLYIAIGLFMSSLSSNQIVAAIAGFAVLFGGTLGLTILAYSSPNPDVRTIGQFFSPFAHMWDFARGIVDSRSVVLYITYTAWFLFASIKVVQTKRS